MCFMFHRAFSNHVENVHIIDQYRKINDQKFYNGRQTITAAATTTAKHHGRRKKIEVQKVTFNIKQNN